MNAGDALGDRAENPKIVVGLEFRVQSALQADFGGPSVPRLFGAGVRLVDESALDAALARELVRLAGPAGSEERAAMTAALAEAVPVDASERLCETLLELAR